MPYPNERIAGKAQLLEELDPNDQLPLEGTFVIHVANAISASSPAERRQEIDKAIELYENALDNALHEVLGSTSTASNEEQLTDTS